MHGSARIKRQRRRRLSATQLRAGLLATALARHRGEGLLLQLRTGGLTRSGLAMLFINLFRCSSAARALADGADTHRRTRPQGEGGDAPAFGCSTSRIQTTPAPAAHNQPTPPPPEGRLRNGPQGHCELNSTQQYFKRKYKHTESFYFVFIFL